MTRKNRWYKKLLKKLIYPIEFIGTVQRPFIPFESRFLFKRVEIVKVSPIKFTGQDGYREKMSLWTQVSFGSIYIFKGRSVKLVDGTTERKVDLVED